MLIPEGAMEPIATTLRVSELKALSGARRKRWAHLISQVPALDRTALVFLGEVLELLDDGAPCAFECRAYSDYDMFGGCSQDWTLSTERARLTRRLEREMGESWQSVEARVDEVRVHGLKAPRELEWDGSLPNAGLPLEVRVRGVDGALADRLASLARDLFRQVRETRS